MQSMPCMVVLSFAQEENADVAREVVVVSEWRERMTFLRITPSCQIKYANMAD